MQKLLDNTNINISFKDCFLQQTYVYFGWHREWKAKVRANNVRVRHSLLLLFSHELMLLSEQYIFNLVFSSVWCYVSAKYHVSAVSFCTSCMMLLQLTCLLVVRYVTEHQSQVWSLARRVGWGHGSRWWRPGALESGTEASCHQAFGTLTARWQRNQDRWISRPDLRTTRPAWSGSPAVSGSYYTPRSPRKTKIRVDDTMTATVYGNFHVPLLPRKTDLH